MWSVTKAITRAKKVDVQDDHFEKTLPDCPFPNLSFRITGEPKHLVGERIHWEPDAAAANFIFE